MIFCISPISALGGIVCLRIDSNFCNRCDTSIRAEKVPPIFARETKCTTRIFEFVRGWKVIVTGHSQNFTKSTRRAIFHATSIVTIFGGYQDPVYIIGGGTVQYSTHKQRTFAPHNLQAGNWPVGRVARSVFVLTTCTNNAVRSGEFDAEFVLPRACSTLLLSSGSSVNNLLLCVR
jgi:hypothetical protein